MLCQDYAISIHLCDVERSGLLTLMWTGVLREDCTKKDISLSEETEYVVTEKTECNCKVTEHSKKTIVENEKNIFKISAHRAKALETKSGEESGFGQKWEKIHHLFLLVQ